MSSGLSRVVVQRYLVKLREAVARQDCWSCDCLQGLLVQLELDADQDVSDLLGPLKVARQEMHACLGCTPCPPGALFADYLRDQQSAYCADAPTAASCTNRQE